MRNIAQLAGVSKDLVAYPFGGKEDFYEAVQHAWLTRENPFVDRTLPLAENLARYTMARPGGGMA